MAPFCIFHPDFFLSFLAFLKLMDGPFLYFSPIFLEKTGFRHWRLRKSRNLWKNEGFHGVQTLEIPRVEGFVKKRWISLDSVTPDSESQGFCGTTGDFTEFRESRFQKSVTSDTRDPESQGISSFWSMDGPYFLWSLWMPLLRYGAIHKLNFAFLKLMDGPFLIF